MHRLLPGPRSRSRVLLLLAGATLMFLGLALTGRSSAAPADDPYAHIPFTFAGPGLEAFPGPGQSVTSSGGSLFLRLAGEAALNQGQDLSVALDDRDITSSCRRQGLVRTFVLPPGLEPGLHRVTVTLPSLLSGSRAITWQFTAADSTTDTGPASALVVTHNGARTLFEGDVIEVRVEGPPGGRGTASVGSIRMPLGEVKQGVYTATHEVVHADYCIGRPVEAEIAFADGRVLSGASKTPLKLFGQLFTVRIITPESGQRVPWDFVIKGRTRPRCLVTITPTFGGGSPPHSDLTGPPAPGTVGRNLGTIETTSDEHGYFSQKFGFPLHLADIAYGFKVTAIDAKGEQAIPATFRVVLGAKKSPPKASPSPTPAPSNSNRDWTR